MKKRIIALLTVVMSIIMCFSATGCNLVTKDSERDMEQVVATVKISDGVSAENIYKKDMIMAYLSYGYYYVQYYGYTADKVFTMILDNLIQNRIMVQYIKEDAELNGKVVNSAKAKGDVLRYIDEDQELEAKYNTYKMFNDLLESYEEKEDAKVYDTLSQTARAIPTNATNYVKELSEEEKKDYVKGFDIDSTAKRKDAFNTLYKLMRNNGLLGSEYNGTIESSSYFKESLEDYCENELLTAYQTAIQEEARKVNYETLENEYAKLYQKQQSFTVSDFKTALSSNSKTTPIIFNENGSYGYVYNLLLGANSYQTTQISDIKKNDPNITDADYDDARRAILALTTASDLRASWILSGYDFDGTNFTGDYSIAKNNPLSFKGTTTKIADATDKENAKYRVDDVTVYGLDEFLDLVNEYIYDGGSIVKANGEGAIYKTVNSSLDVEEYDERVNELLFAFSTDPGSLNTYKGYAISPDNNEGFVETFWTAGKDLVAGTYGTNGYMVVASDYGYHIMFYSEQLNVNFATLTEYLNSVYAVSEDDAYWQSEVEDLISRWDDLEDDETSSYLYNLVSTITNTKVSNALSNAVNGIVNEYRYEKSGCVKVYEKAYKDLIG